MLSHYVFIKYRSGTSETHIEEFISRTLALRTAISEIEHLEIGRDILHSARSFDLVLVMRFANVDALRRYQPHPEHVKVMEFNQACVESVATVDFEEVRR